MFEKVKEIDEKYKQIAARLSDPTLPPKDYQQFAKEEASLRPIIETYRLLEKKKEELQENKNLLDEKDEAIRALAKEEIPGLEKEIEALSQQLQFHLIPKDPNDDKNIFLEIRAGTGGEEAALFVANLFRMYSRFAEDQRWKIELISSNPTGIGGLKEVIALISGHKVYSKLKYESGIHRVQRVPKTETSGRIHTSAVTVAVMPEVEDVEIEIRQQDLRIDVFRSGGCGGQSVNTTDSAVRITHLPSNLVVVCQDEKSQHKNKAKAMGVLKARLYDKKLQEQEDAQAKERREQVKSGDRSEKIRTYNFPQSRVTDHRIGLTLHQLDSIMEGHLDSLINPLQTHYQSEALRNLEK